VILPDVNVLVYAFRRDTERHQRYTNWLLALTGGTDELALTEISLTGLVRIVTNPQIFADPAPASVALAFVDRLRHAPRARWLAPTEAVWTAFASLAATDRQVRGNLIPDAWLAALARAHGCRVATADRGFARFDGVDSFDPARS